MQVLFELLRAIGPVGCVFLAMLGFYEGVPGLNRVAVLAEIPVVGDIALGRVELAKRSAVEGMVARAELAALQSTIDEETRLRKVAEDAAAADRERASALARLAAERQSALDQREAEARATPGVTYPSPEDLKWLQKRLQ